MALSNIPLEQISERHLQGLMRAGAAESLYIEYKQQTYGNSDSDHAEYLADVSSFANAAGGDLAIGMSANSGVPTGFVPFAGDVDAEKRRLEDIARTGLEPRIPNLSVAAVALAGGGHVLIVRAPRSFIGPHRVNYRGRNRFWARSSAGRYEPNVQELRRLFTEAPQLAERIRAFRLDRLARIVAGETPVTVPAGSKLVLHVVPYSAFDVRNTLSVAQMQANGLLFPPLGRSDPTHWESNFDGFLTLSNADQRTRTHHSYAQVFRTGAVEGVSTIESDHAGTPAVIATKIERYCVGNTHRWLRGLEACGVGPSFAILASLIEVQGRYLLTGIAGSPAEKVINQRELHFSEAVLESIPANPQDCAQALERPLLEQLWNAAGYASMQTMRADRTWVVVPD